MIHINEHRKLFSTLFIYVMFLVGYVGHLVPFTHDLMISLTPFFLFGMGVFVIQEAIIKKNLRFLLWVSITYLVTFSIEAAGVATGLIFGDYTYGTSLGFMVLSVPVVIGFNWVLVVLGSVLLTGRYVRNIHIAAVIGGLISMIFDIFLEPVAIKFDYWGWVGGSIPLQNYAAWFVIGTLFSYSFLRLRMRYISNLPVHYLLAQSLFFLFLQLSFHF